MDLNIVIKNENFNPETDVGFAERLFGLDIDPNQKITYIPGDATFDILDVLVLLNVFPSRSQARKNWKGPIQFPPGVSDFTVGKQRHSVWIWNPMPWVDNAEDQA